MKSHKSNDETPSLNIPPTPENKYIQKPIVPNRNPNFFKKNYQINSEEVEISKKNRNDNYIFKKEIKLNVPQKEKEKKNNTKKAELFPQINMHPTKIEEKERKSERESYHESKGSDIDEKKEKELKLLKNRLSARKCRQKKKNYIKQLEEQVKSYKDQIEHFKSEINKEKSIENYMNILDEKEKEIEQSSNKKKADISKNEFVTTQKILLNYLFLYQIKVMMPIECKLFQNKFIKLAQFEDGDSVEAIILKINNNIKMLNELYDFKRRNTHSAISTKGKEGTAYKLYLFYENMKKYTEIFISNYSII